MPENIQVSRLETRSHNAPDERRTPQLTEVDIVRLHDCTLGRFSLRPGWRWSECIRPIVGTPSCQLSHMGHVIKGRLKVRLDDGAETSLEPGMSYTIPPGQWGRHCRPIRDVGVCDRPPMARRTARPVQEQHLDPHRPRARPGIFLRLGGRTRPGILPEPLHFSSCNLALTATRIYSC